MLGLLVGMKLLKLQGKTQICLSMGANGFVGDCSIYNERSTVAFFVLGCLTIEECSISHLLNYSTITTTTMKFVIDGWKTAADVKL